MAKRNVVAWLWRNEHYVTAERGRSRGTRIDNFGAVWNLLQGRFRERAEPSREARILVAVLVSVEDSGAREVLAVVVRIAAGGTHAEIFCLAHWGCSILCATPARHEQSEHWKSNSVRHLGPPFSMRFAAGDAFALDPADTGPHDRRASSTAPHRKLTKLPQRQNVGPRASGNALPAERDSSSPCVRATKKVVGPARNSRPRWQAGTSARPHRGLPLARELGFARAAFARPGGVRNPTRPRQRFHSLVGARAPAQSGPGPGRRLGIRGSDSRSSVGSRGRALQGGASRRISLYRQS